MARRVSLSPAVVVALFGFAGVAVCLLVNKTSWLPVVAGLSFSLMLAPLAGLISGWAVSSWDIEKPVKRKNGDSVSLLQQDRAGLGPFITGVAEAVLFYAAFVSGAYDLAAGWLIFKTAAKWAAWQHIMRMPESLEELDDIDFMRYRHRLSSRLATAFIVGTIVNLLLALAGYVLSQAFATAFHVST